MGQFLSIILSSLIVLLLNTNLYANQSSCSHDSLYLQVQDITDLDLEAALSQKDISLSELFEKYDTTCVVNLYIDFVNKNTGRKAIYHLVFDDLWDALLLADQANLEEEKSKIYIDLARFFGYLKKYEQAQEYFRHASSILSSHTIKPRKLKELYVHQAQMYNEKGEQNLARLYLDSCYQVIDKYDLPPDNFLDYRRGAILRDEGQHRKAIEIFQSVANKAASTHPAVNGIVYYNIGKSYIQLDNAEQAIQYYNQSIATIEQYESHLDHLPKIHQLLAEAYYSIGSLKDAYHHSKIASELQKVYGNPSESMSNHLVDVKDAFKEFKTQQDIQSKKLELEKLNQEKRVLALQQWLLAGGIIFLILTSLILFYTQNQKLKSEQRYNQALASRNEEIKSLYNDLEKKNEDQVIFSRIMTHDLKAPLRTIQGFSALIQDDLNRDIIPKQKVSKYNGIVMSASSSMIQLIEDLLYYFKLGANEQEFTQVDLNAMVDETCKSFSFDLIAKNILLDIGPLPAVSGIQELLKTVFHNLISNALKYQPLDKQRHIPKIQFYSTSDNDNHYIFIKDNGIGIKSEFQEKIFDSFSKLHNSTDYDGSGLGLSISKAIMLKHNGNIVLEESKQGETVFKLTFPYKQT